MIGQSEFINLVLYCAQQLGMTLSVGAQTIILLAYLMAMRDRMVDAKEAQFRKAVRAVLFSGLGLVILSGAGITALHFFAGEFSVIAAPAFVFKWILVFLVLMLSAGIGGGFLPEWAAEGFVGGTWYALFLLHILAPVTTWDNLLMLYIGWVVAFCAIWSALVFGTREKVSKPKPATHPAPAPQAIKTPEPPKKVLEPVAAAGSKPATAPKTLPSSAFPDIPSRPLIPPVVVPPAPAPAPAVVTIGPSSTLVHPAMPDLDEHPNLPAIRVMPKTPQEIQNQNRPVVVKT